MHFGLLNIYKTATDNFYLNPVILQQTYDQLTSCFTRYSGWVQHFIDFFYSTQTSLRL